MVAKTMVQSGRRARAKNGPEKQVRSCAGSGWRGRDPSETRDPSRYVEENCAAFEFESRALFLVYKDELVGSKQNVRQTLPNVCLGAFFDLSRRRDRPGYVQRLHPHWLIAQSRLRNLIASAI